MSELENIKVGDRVTVFQHGNPYAIRRVSRITKTLIVTVWNAPEYEDRWRKSDGYMAGSDKWARQYILPTKQEHRDFIQHANLYHKVTARISTGGGRKLSIDQLAQILEILNSVEEKTE
jgi:hypothetical protein